MAVGMRGGHSASDEAIQELEFALGCPLSAPFKEFLKTHDGAKPEPNTFRISDNNDGGVTRFIPAQEILGDRRFLEDIPQRAYPVARLECGNFAFIDEGEGGAVFHWDHELPDEITRLAEDFGMFLDQLKPFDINSVTLKPGQVKSVWIDPEFLRKLKERGEYD